MNAGQDNFLYPPAKRGSDILFYYIARNTDRFSTGDPGDTKCAEIIASILRFNESPRTSAPSRNWDPAGSDASRSVHQVQVLRGHFSVDLG